MAIIIHQAICGEQNKAWELLKTTLDDNSLAKKIAFQTDLQDSPPSGLQWLPVIRGFIFGNHFLLIKTYQDNSPDVRNGRVFSHCLILNKTDLPEISDISPLLSVFRSEIDKSIHLEPITLTPEQQKSVVLKGSLQLRFNKVIQSFLNFTSGLESLIWVGQEHFEIAVCRMWQLLSPMQRENFYFGINFNPSEVVKDKSTFVVIPENSESKFINRGLTLIRKEDSIQLTEFADQFLAGEENAIARIQNFVSAIEANKPTPREVLVIAKGVSTFENLDKEKDLRLLNTLSNIIAKYSPNENRGTLVKAKLVERISLLIEKASESEVLLLKNFQITSFKGSKKKISLCINKWCSNFLLNEKQNQKVNYVPFIAQVSESQKDNWLVTLILQNIYDFLSNVNETAAAIIWKWVSNDVSILEIISEKIEHTKTAEKNLYESIFDIDKTTLAQVKPFILKRKWFRLYATILKSEYDFKNAIEAYLQIDTDKNSYEGIEILVKGIKSKEIISFAVGNGDSRFIHLSGKLCSQDKSLLSDIQVENLNWQKIWLTSINNGNKVQEGIKEPQVTIHKLFDLLVVGKAVSESLVEKISETDYANILTYGNRSKIWAKLPTKSKRKFLERTAANLLETLSKNSTYQVPSDAELSSYIISNAISDFLYYNRSSIKTVLPIFNTYTQTPEVIIRDYVSNYAGGVDIIDSVQLGKLILSRNLSKVAHTVKAKVKDIHNFKYALAECHSLLGLIDRGMLFISGTIDDLTISEDEWWSAFSSTSFRLYQEGPSENQIWKQAGGHNYDLNLSGSGKESWLKALDKLRKGVCKDITPKKLLKAMIEEFPKNQELRTLKELWNRL